MEVRDISELKPCAESQLSAAKYYIHKIRAHQYAVAVLSGQLSEDAAKEEYRKSMENMQSVLDGCLSTNEANRKELARGADAVSDMVEAYS